MTKRKPVTITLHLPLQSKERPRTITNPKAKSHYVLRADGSVGVKTTRKTATNSEHYRNWTSKAKTCIRLAYGGKPFDCCAVHVEAHGLARNDADNLLGAILDAGIGLLWVNDNVRICRRVSCEWFRAPSNQQKWVIHIEPLEYVK